MSFLDEIRNSTRADVENALAEAKARHHELEIELRRVEREIDLAENWLGTPKTPARPRTLQDAMIAVLQEQGNHGLKPAELADAVTARGLYRMRDGRPVGAHGIQARVTNYPHLFVRENGRIRMREEHEAE